MKYRVLIRRTTQEFGSVIVEAETQVVDNRHFDADKFQAAAKK